MEGRDGFFQPHWLTTCRVNQVVSDMEIHGELRVYVVFAQYSHEREPQKRLLFVCPSFSLLMSWPELPPMACKRNGHLAGEMGERRDKVCEWLMRDNAGQRTSLLLLLLLPLLSTPRPYFFLTHLHSYHSVLSESGNPMEPNTDLSREGQRPWAKQR